MSDESGFSVVDEGDELSVHAADLGFASFLYGSTRHVVETLLAAERAETAEWAADAGDESIAWLTGIEVVPGQRRLGLGSEMLVRGLEELEQRGVALVFLNSMPDLGYERKLPAWYRKHGFRSAGKMDGTTVYFQHLSGE